MFSVIFVLIFNKAEEEKDLLQLKADLQESNIDFVEWIEMPENTLASIVLKPCEKESVSQTVRKFKLYK